MVDLLSLEDPPALEPCPPEPSPPSPGQLFARAGLLGKMGRAQGSLLLDSETLQIQVTLTLT